jgi:hypothetical protein
VRPLVELIVAVLTVLFDVVQKHLHLALALKRFSPVGNLNSFIDKRIARLEFDLLYVAANLNTERPNA